MIPLELLSPGQWAAITDVFGDAHNISRLAELGLRPGVRVQMLQPGSPCLIQVEGTRLGLRGDVAEHLLVVPQPPAGP